MQCVSEPFGHENVGPIWPPSRFVIFHVSVETPPGQVTIMDWKSTEVLLAEAVAALRDGQWRCQQRHAGCLLDFVPHRHATVRRVGQDLTDVLLQRLRPLDERQSLGTVVVPPGLTDNARSALRRARAA